MNRATAIHSERILVAGCSFARVLLLIKEYTCKIDKRSRNRGRNSAGSGPTRHLKDLRECDWLGAYRFHHQAVSCGIL